MQIKVGANLYPFPTKPLVLGEQRLLKHEFKFIPGVDELDLRDPDHMSAMVFAVMREADPDAPAASLVTRIYRVREIDIVGDDGEPLPEDGESLADDEAAGVVEDPPPAEPVEEASS